MVDLHSHSTASDGEKTPAGLVEAAKEAGLCAVALTDHDTVDGLGEAAACARRIGMTFVPGIEINIQREKGEFHLLGLGLSEISASMKILVLDLKRRRTERNKKIFFYLENDGLDLSYEDFLLCEGAGHDEDTLGRPHIAAYLVRKKIVKDRQRAFEKYLSKKSPFFAPFEGVRLEDGVKAILDSGGVPVIAHPLSLYESWGRLEGTLREMREKGVLGLEAWHPGARENDCRRLERIARSLGFFVTAGSDFHGPNVRADRKLGFTSGGYKIDDRFYFEELLPSLEAARGAKTAEASF